MANRMKRKNLLGVTLLFFGALSLLFGWPWGSLVGAILALAGVLALRLQPSGVPQAEKAAPQPPFPSSEPSTRDDAEQLMTKIKEMEGRGETVPDEHLSRTQHAIHDGWDEWFQKYESVTSTSGNRVADLSAFAQDFRVRYGWPSNGSVLGYEAATEEIDFVLTRIEHFGGKVPVREAMFMQAMLEDGPELRYFSERLKRGYPSLFANEANIDWNSDPGFFERYLRIRHNNPFFPPEKQCVSQHDVYLARRMDANDKADLVGSWKQCLEAIMQSRDFAPASEVAEHLHTMYGLLEQAAMIGAANSKLAKDVRTSYDTVLAGIYRSLEDKPDIKRGLEKAEATRWAGSAFTLNSSVRQVSRIEDKADIVPVMMTENVDNIRTMVEPLEPKALADVQSVILDIMRERPAARELLRRQPEKLVAFRLDVAVADNASASGR